MIFLKIATNLVSGLHTCTAADEESLLEGREDPLPSGKKLRANFANAHAPEQSRRISSLLRKVKEMKTGDIQVARIL